jgi:hypothetical protein
MSIGWKSVILVAPLLGALGSPSDRVLVLGAHVVNFLDQLQHRVHRNLPRLSAQGAGLELAHHELKMLEVHFLQKSQAPDRRLDPVQARYEVQ